MALEGCTMWIPTQDEAVEMYARFLSARRGKAAGRYARKTADRLLAEGDIPGHIIWTRVADTVESDVAKGVITKSVMAPSQ